MKLWVPFLLFEASWGCSDATKVLANIYVRKRLLSGGVLIRKDIVITTALYIQHSIGDIRVSLNRHRNATLRDLEPRLEVVGMAIHPDFKHQREPVNNLALLMVDRRGELPCQVALDTARLGSQTGLDMLLVGWGYKREYWEEVEHLKSISLPIFFYHYCWGIIFDYRGYSMDQESEFCAGTEHGNPEAALVNHGSPLFHVHGDKLTLVGLYSYTAISGNMQYSPGVFTRISNFVPWILDSIEDEVD